MSNEYFDAGYGIISISITTTGATVVATTAGYYHGVAMVAGTAAVTTFVYDASVATSGNIVDAIYITVTGSARSEKYIPVVCRKGITISVTGTGANGAIFFGPRG